MLRNTVSRGARGFATAAKSSQKNIVMVDGIRLPFAMQSTIYNDLLAVDLQRLALKSLLTKTALDPAMVDYVLCGTVIQETKTSNIAREASMGAGIPLSVPSHTVTQACISSSVAICTAAEKIMAGQADVVIAGGVETFSDVPIRFSRKVRQKLIGAPKAMKKGPAGIAGLLKGLKPGDLAPEAPAIANFTTGEVMGVSSDRLSAKALELGFKPKSYIRDWAFVACDPFEELLLGPTYGAKKCLDSMNLTMDDIGVFEIHEAFAGQVLSNLTAMNSQTFADQRFNGKKVGEIDQSKMNTKGGSLSLGHPFGATGSRLVSTASNRLQREEQRFALLAACADGGLGHAAILERYDN
ncbi:hypothetical protein TL16_g09364 [Triparma laevis f. inornata]|uniref:acetyl-CoA C-acyltransferase n=1 Tax=Triparma laevis f. inornata TaxID=1714386 RepID=A0A9W7B615_9STRA|nr:hypothetical protein TL16_g09364 [Triparma laevis f. inornata]